MVCYDNWWDITNKMTSIWILITNFQCASIHKLMSINAIKKNAPYPKSSFDTALRTHHNLLVTNAPPRNRISESAVPHSQFETMHTLPKNLPDSSKLHEGAWVQWMPSFWFQGIPLKFSLQQGRWQGCRGIPRSQGRLSQVWLLGEECGGLPRRKGLHGKDRWDASGLFGRETFK